MALAALCFHSAHTTTELTPPLSSHHTSLQHCHATALGDFDRVDEGPPVIGCEWSVREGTVGEADAEAARRENPMRDGSGGGPISDGKRPQEDGVHALCVR